MATSMDDAKKKWHRKLPYRIYDYNYKVGESYYNPQTDYIENRDLLRSKVQPPDCASYAERFVAKPIYGETRGLPYNESQSALTQPLITRRPSSRASSRERDFEEPPSATRPGRSREPVGSRDKRLSFSLGDSNDATEPPRRRKFSLADDLDFKVPVSKYVDADFGFRSSIERDDFSDSPIGLNPAMKESIKSDIKKLEKEFKKANAIKRGTGGPKSKHWEEVVYNDAIDSPGKKTVKRDEISYTVPGTGTNVRKSSYQESTKFESSKPPRAPLASSRLPPRPSRMLSMEDSSSRGQRRRHISVSNDEDLDFQLPSLRRSSLVDDAEKRFSSAQKMFDHRRAKESEELTDNINKMLTKMRKSSISDAEPRESHTYTRTVRSSSLGPYEKDTKVRTRSVRSRANNYTYGFSK